MKKLSSENDTIAAISTPLGEGGFGIVRLSGKKSIEIVSRLFYSPRGTNILSVPTYTVHYGYIKNSDGIIVDEVLVSIYRTPKSYTREDVVEISGHGGIVSLRRILELCLFHGARIADPGEFTKRAFINGRVDLSQAEAVCDIIRSRTNRAEELAVLQLTGKLSENIKILRNDILATVSQIESELDFTDTEPDVISADTKKFVTALESIIKKLEKLAESYDSGKIIRDGIRLAIVGKPNVGKSCLLNTLLNHDRAIVTNIPGTTRDTIEEVLTINGLPFVLTDTAGVRKPKNEIETIGIQRTKNAIKYSDIVLFVVDRSRKLSVLDYKISTEIKHKKVVLVINKTDLKNKINTQSILPSLPKGTISVEISALFNKGIDSLKKCISSFIFAGKISLDEPLIITNLRHKNAVEKTLKSVKQSLKLINQKSDRELVSYELRQSLDSLGELVGETYTDDILDQIFSRFCIGK